jgi:hypothetical protein
VAEKAVAFALLISAAKIAAIPLTDKGRRLTIGWNAMLATPTDQLLDMAALGL